MPERRPGARPEGWVAGARRVPSPNCDSRPAGARISLAVLHAISLPRGRYGSDAGGDAIEQLFTNRLDPAAHPSFAGLAGLRVSSHFLIRRSGSLVQFVPVGLRAWHAGASHWRGRDGCNDFSIGIELEGCDDRPYAEAQYLALRPLLFALRSTCPIAAVVGHSDIAPGRKTDPGPHFDWTRLRSELASGV